MLTSAVRLGRGQQVLDQVGDRVRIQVLEVLAGRQTGIGHRELAPSRDVRRVVIGEVLR